VAVAAVLAVTTKDRAEMALLVGEQHPLQQNTAQILAMVQTPMAAQVIPPQHLQAKEITVAALT
jgi:hypothetical protein